MNCVPGVSSSGESPRAPAAAAAAFADVLRRRLCCVAIFAMGPEPSIASST